MACEVKMLAASRCEETGNEIMSLQLRYWRAIHAEMMTHRAFSRNAGSSRAIPVKKMLAQVWNDPAGPVYWGANQAGMQAHAQITGWRLKAARLAWRTAGKMACGFAWGLMKLGLHKQVANRLLEPWQYINVVVTATDWQNFFDLRCHEAAQPEMQELAFRMELEWLTAGGVMRPLKKGEWHLVYISEEELATLPIETLLKLSAARAARVSYEPYDGDASHEKEIARHDALVGSAPIHASPCEHQAQCMASDDRYANFQGFRQYRSFVEEAASNQTEVKA